MGLLVRPTVASDIPIIDRLCKHITRIDVEASYLLETALLCLTAVDTSKENLVVGFLCLDDTACLRLDQKPIKGASADALTWLTATLASRPALAGPSVSASAYVRVAACLADYDLEAMAALLRSAMVTIPALRTLLVLTAVDLTFDEPGLGAVFERQVADKATGAILYTAPRDMVLQPLLVRVARVEDHDDMLPILTRASSKFPALAKLPETARPDEPFALTRVVAGQNESNYVFVAEQGGVLVGFMVVTSEVETGSLLGTFDLHPFDNFLPPELYEQQYKEAREAACVLKAEEAKKKADAIKAEKAKAAAQQAAETQTDPPPEAVAAAAAAAAAAGEAEGATAAEEAPKDGDAEDAPAAEEPNEEEVRYEMLRLFGPQADQDDVTAPITSAVEPNMFAITMMCIDEEFEAQGPEFFKQAFAAFGSKEYCVLTLPHDSPEPPLLGTMMRIPPITGSIFPEVLYLFNRHALEEDFDVRLATESDAAEVSGLVEGMANSADILKSFQDSLARNSGAVATCQGHVVGLCTLNPQVDLTLLQANFGLSGLVDMHQHPPDKHGEIDMYCINPIFVSRHRAFLTGMQRLFHRTVLHYALPPGQQPPDMLEVLSQVPPRHRSVAAGLQAEFALYIFNRRNAFVRPRSVNAQVVVVGASEAGLAAIERLLLDKEFNFNYITLLAPQGISVGGVTCQYTASVIAKLGLEARVTLLDCEMVGLDRSRRAIELSNGTYIIYDLLLITAGLQDQTRNSLSEADPDAAGFVLNTMELAAEFSLGDAQVMQSIVVYGSSLAAYQALSTLEARGAGPKVRFVTPPGVEEPMVKVLRDVTRKLKVALPVPEVVTIVELATNWKFGAASATATFQAEGAEPEAKHVDLVVGTCPVKTGAHLFRCLNDSSLVFDGRLVVDGAFRTNDPQIYAAGTIAKLSRRLAANVLLEHYNSKEVGQMLAQSVIAHFKGEQRPDQLPKLSTAKVVGCTLPSLETLPLTFMYAASATSLAKPSLDPPAGGRSMVSDTLENSQSIAGYYLQINVDASSCIDSMLYIGKATLQPARLSSLVGLHINYFNGLSERWSHGNIKDLMGFLTEPWSDLLYHDEFPAFRNAMTHSALSTLAGKHWFHNGFGMVAAEASPVEVTLGVQDETLEFIRSKLGEFQSYNVPVYSTGATPA